MIQSNFDYFPFGFYKFLDFRVLDFLFNIPENFGQFHSHKLITVMIKNVSPFEKSSKNALLLP